MTTAKVLLFLLLVCALLTACDRQAPDTLLTYQGREYGLDALEQELAHPLYKDMADQPRKRVVETAVENLMLRIFVEQHPALPDERKQARFIQEVRDTHGCINLHVKETLAGLRTRSLDKELQQYFKQHIQDFIDQEAFNLEMIFIPVEQDPKGALANKVLARLREKPEQFPALVKRYSRSGTAGNKGVTGLIKGQSVSKEIRKAVAEHRDGKDYFLVSLSRGHYILRVLSYAEAFTPTFADVEKEIFAHWQKAQFDRVYENIEQQVLDTLPMEVNKSLFLYPRVQMDDWIYRLDDTTFRVQDLYPYRSTNTPICGPQLKREYKQHLRFELAKRHFNCRPDTGEKGKEKQAEILYQLKLQRVLEGFAREHLATKVRQYASIHAEGFMRPELFVLDVFLLPLHGGDPYQELKDYQPLIERIVSSGDNKQDWSDSDIMVFYNQAFSQAQLLAYSQKVLNLVDGTPQGAFSAPAYSKAFDAFIIIYDRGVEAAEAADMAQPDEFKRVVNQYLEDNMEEVLQAFHGHIAPLFKVNRDLLNTFTTQDATNSADS